MVNVVTAVPSRNIGEKNQEKIRNVSPKINLQDVTSWVSEEQAGNWSHRKELDAILGSAEVLLAGTLTLPQDLIKRAPQLKWMQMTFTGMEDIVKDKNLVESSVKLTNASGIQAEAISEYVITLMLAFDKHLLTFSEQKKLKHWKKITMVGLASQTIGIMGLGNIGKEVARKAKALGMHVIAFDRPRKLMRAVCR